MYAGVLVDLNAEAVDKVFIYAIPDGMALCPGQRVMVPFGFRTLEGIVVSVAEETSVADDKLREVIKPLEDYPAITGELMQLAGWVKDKYFCTYALALRLMIPSQLRGERVREMTVKTASLLVDADAFDEAVKSCGRSKKQAQILELLKDGKKPVPWLNVICPGARTAVKALVEKGYVEVMEEESLRDPFKGETTRGHTDPEPTRQQKAAIDAATQAMDDRRGRFLLSGVTGSGKTEVYIALIRHALEMGKGAIVLVPEISLTPQMVDWFRSRFGENAAVLHSRLSAGERYDEWRRVRRGDARVVVGARSAVFAPVENLGLVVVDEEHELSYQSGNRPRYDARDVARKRCDISGATLVLGSATPSIASYMKTMPGVKPQNKLELLELGERVFARPMPDVVVVDMTQELKRGNATILSAELRDSLSACLDSGHQAMLLINRRGFSTFLSCRSCGHVVKCDMCDVSLTYHKYDGLLKCHYCGLTKTPPAVCPNCSSRAIKYFGAGTQQVEDIIRAEYPQARVARMDIDTTSAKGAHERILTAFQKGETDILIGTQMIAKGLDFPNVTLVGVVAADITLNLPDYRAPERTFQLITQVAGRAGRAQYPGHVVIQTYEPENYAIKLAARQDYRAFYHEETKRRRRALYPPFTVIARIIASGKDAQAVKEEAQKAAEGIEEYISEGRRRENIVRLTCEAAPISRIDGYTRWQILMKLYARNESDEILRHLEDAAHEKAEGVKMELEINPTNLY
ncbi:MAG: primosomal protein N' [Clostridia bacterium]|nr:primosomal protein N' [Clostridia bacterium]